jgi:hypothetical protein
MENELYDAMKFVAQILLPAVATLYSAIAPIWNLPDVAQIVGTVSAVDTALGLILARSSKNYVPPLIVPKQTDGRLLVDKTDPTKDTYSFELTTPLNTLDQKDHIVLEVGARTMDTPTNGVAK